MKCLCFLLMIWMLALSQAQITIAAAGDISCHQDDTAGCAMVETSDLILQEPVRAVLALGDLQYPDGSLNDFQQSYDVSWGRFKNITYPTPGNHEYHTKNAKGYFDYFGSVVGNSEKPYYSFMLGDWQIFSLNSNCDEVACDEASDQVKWLEQELKNNSAVCTMAFWHHPRFSSGPHGNNKNLIPIWNTLQSYKADIVLSGHDHLYERFPRKDADGSPDSKGIRQFVVGTGGKHLYQVMNLFPQSEVLDSKHFGVLFLTLGPTSYQWRFVTIEGEVIDEGQEDCIK